MNVIILKNLLDTKLLDRWTQAIEQIQSTEGRVYDQQSVGNEGSFNTQVRECETRFVDAIKHPRLYRNIHCELLPIFQAHNSTFRVDLFGNLEIQHATYNVGGHFIEHTDMDLSANISNMTHRKISMVVMMSDPSEYEGGNLTLGSSKKIIPNERGTIVLFSSFTAHAVEKVTKGQRKTLVVWAHGPPWR